MILTCNQSVKIHHYLTPDSEPMKLYVFIRAKRVLVKKNMNQLELKCMVHMIGGTILVALLKKGKTLNTLTQEKKWEDL